MLKRDRKLAFDIVIPTEHGAFYCACFKRKKEVHLVMLGENTKMAIAKAHALLGHGNESSTRETAKYLGWTISRRAFMQCKNCVIVKAQ